MIAVSTVISISDNVIHGFKTTALLNSFRGNLVRSSNLFPDNNEIPSIYGLSEEKNKAEKLKKSSRERRKQTK